MSQFIDDFKRGYEKNEDDSFGSGIGKLFSYITNGFKYPTVDYDEQREALNEQIGETLVVKNPSKNSEGDSLTMTNIVGSGIVIILLIFVIFDR